MLSEVERKSTTSIHTSGVVTSWLGSYGFIEHAQGQKDAFVHINQTKRPLREGTRVEFDLHRTANGFEARNVQVLQ